MIPFRGLNIGVHQFNWEIDNRFFEEIENSGIHDAELFTELTFEKQERMFVLQFTINGNVTVKCDRCLDDLKYPISINEKVYVKFGEEEMEETEEIIIIPETDYQIDISQLIYEFIELSLPMRKIHEDDESEKSMCNTEMISKLNEHSGNKKTDPRWDKLKNLKLGN